MAEITLSKIRWLLDKAYPKIGSRPVAKITAQEVLAVLRSIEATGRYESARRMRSVLSRVFRYAIEGYTGHAITLFGRPICSCARANCARPSGANSTSIVRSGTSPSRR